MLLESAMHRSPPNGKDAAAAYSDSTPTHTPPTRPSWPVLKGAAPHKLHKGIIPSIPLSHPALPRGVNAAPHKPTFIPSPAGGRTSAAEAGEASPPTIS